MRRFPDFGARDREEEGENGASATATDARSDDLNRVFGRFRAQGDVVALGEVFDRVAPDLVRIARHLLRDVAAAEDAVLRAFLAAIDPAHDFHQEVPIRPWLCRFVFRYAKEEWLASAAIPLEASSEASPAGAGRLHAIARTFDQGFERLLSRRAVDSRTAPAVARSRHPDPIEFLEPYEDRESRGLEVIRAALLAKVAARAFARKRRNRLLGPTAKDIGAAAAAVVLLFSVLVGTGVLGGSSSREDALASDPLDSPLAALPPDEAAFPEGDVLATEADPVASARLSVRVERPSTMRTSIAIEQFDEERGGYVAVAGLDLPPDALSRCRGQSVSFDRLANGVYRAKDGSSGAVSNSVRLAEGDREEVRLSIAE